MCILALKGRQIIGRGERSVAPVYTNHPPSQSREAVTEMGIIINRKWSKKYARTFVFSTHDYYQLTIDNSTYPFFLYFCKNEKDL